MWCPVVTSLGVDFFIVWSTSLCWRPTAPVTRTLLTQQPKLDQDMNFPFYCSGRKQFLPFFPQQDITPITTASPPRPP